MLLLIFAQVISFIKFSPQASAASKVIRTTTYELQAATYTGLVYTLNLNNDLSSNYFTMITGPSNATGSRGLGQDSIRVSGDSHGNFATSTSVDQLELLRENTTNDWIGSVTVVECLIACSSAGFELSEVLETNIPTGTADAQQSVVETLADNYSDNTTVFGGRFGGGLSTTSTDANVFSASGGVKIQKTNGNQVNISRYGAESRVPALATLVSYVVEWGSDWNVQTANVAGINSGQGVDAAGEYNTAAISSVVRANTWVWGSGFTRNDGLGDGAFGQVITLGDGVTENVTENLVAVGSELTQISPGRDFQVFVMENNKLSVDHSFRVRGDQGATSGFQELNQTISSSIDLESYDNASTSVQYTEGARAATFYSTSAGNGTAYSRPIWSLRITSDTNLNYWRAYAGQPVTGWFQVMDFGNLEFSNVDSNQQSFRWRDDSTNLNTDGGWLAAENTVISSVDKNSKVRLRMRVANHGTTAEEAARKYELQYSYMSPVETCSVVSSWTGVSDSADAFELFNSSHISPDGQFISSGLLSNGDGFSFVTGEGRESLDTTGNIGPMSAGAYTELEYAIRPTDDAVTGASYCFRVYDKAINDNLESYDQYPQLTISSTDVDVTGLGEAGTFNSEVDGGWTTINFIGNYTTPVVVGTNNSHNGQSAIVFESKNVTSSSAEMRICESEGAGANGCDSHSSESVGYMVIDASVAATTPGIEAGTFTANGESDASSVVTNYSGSFTTTPYVFSNVNTVNSTEFPIEVIVSVTSTTGFTAGICDHLQGSNDVCDSSHINETVGWVALEPDNLPFQEQSSIGEVSNPGSGVWVPVSFSPSFSSTPALIVSSQTDNGGQDVEIDEAQNVTTTGADVRNCEIDTGDGCDSHNADDVAWFAIEQGEFENTTRLDQDGFRFYDNTNNTTPVTSLGAENTAISNVDDGDVIRIRTALQVGETQIEADKFSIKLQYGAGSICSDIVSWNDVGAIGSGSQWRGYDNATPVDGSTLPTSLLDGATNTVQTYEEQNSSANNPSLVNIGERAEWDWVIENNNADDFTNYCFRTVLGSGASLNYTRYPSLVTSSGFANLNPNDASVLDQKKTSNDSIAVGQAVNESTVKFTAEATDQNPNDILQMCVEVQEIGVPFTNTETNCGLPAIYKASTYACDPTGNAFYEKYDAIAGTALSALFADPDYPNNPSSTQTISGSSLTSGIDIDDNFGGRLSALICAPQDGDYTFWVTGDDETQLNLSTDTNPANVSTIATVPGWSGAGNWTKYPGQQDSGPVTLEAGKYYYVEGIYKEGTGGDHVQIGWTLPDATIERPISNANYSLPTESSAVIETYAGGPVSLSVEVPGLNHASEYHWQARIKDSGGLNSGWTAFGGNSETEIDFSIDTVSPVVEVYDGDTTGVDIEFNEGELDSLSANWEQIVGKKPSELSGLKLWLDVTDIDADGVPRINGSTVPLWSDKSGNGNDISGTGVATYNLANQAVAFSGSVRPFDDTFDRSGGDVNSHTIFSVVTGNASVSNHVWYETTTPRVAPAENGMLGGGTTLSDNHIWSNHITNKKMLTAEYLSSGTSTVWLDRNQEFQFSETQNFSDSQRIVIGDDTTGGNAMEAGEYIHEIAIYNQDLSVSDREAVWENLECKWGLSDCSVTYEYSVGTSPNGTSIKDWTSTGSEAVTASSLNLRTSDVYYFNVRVTDSAGNQAIFSSDGQQVAPTLTFSTDSSGITFDNLNPGNSFTDTESTTVTTSTNARNGYSVRSYATGELESLNGETIGMFAGGSHAAPGEWFSGLYGFGYTSDDPIIEGNNLFSPALCLGAGNGLCFAAYSQSAPGDIVADNPGPVSGVPISDEDFTITHRVTTEQGQSSGSYQTTIIFNASATY